MKKYLTWREKRAILLPMRDLRDMLGVAQGSVTASPRDRLNSATEYAQTTEIINFLQSLGVKYPLRCLAQLKRHLASFDTKETRMGLKKREVTIEMLKKWGS